MHPAVLPIGCLIAAFILYTWLTWTNLQNLIATKQERLEARRAYKKIKNEKLRRFYGLDKKN